jgi:hypothetical protein
VETIDGPGGRAADVEVVRDGLGFDVDVTADVVPPTASGDVSNLQLLASNASTNAAPAYAGTMRPVRIRRPAPRTRESCPVWQVDARMGDR